MGQLGQADKVHLRNPPFVISLALASHSAVLQALFLCILLGMVGCIISHPLSLSKKKKKIISFASPLNMHILNFWASSLNILLTLLLISVAQNTNVVYATETSS